MATKDWQQRYRGKTGSMIIDPFFVGNYMSDHAILGNELWTLDSKINDANRYIVACSFLFDPNSPFVAEQPNIIKRRELVYSEVVYGGLEDYEFEANLLLKIYQDNEWALYCTEQTVFNEFLVRVRMPISISSAEDGGDSDVKKQMDAVLLKDKYLECCDKILNRNKARFIKIFEDDSKLMEAGRKVAATLENLASNTAGQKGRINN